MSAVNDAVAISAFFDHKDAKLRSYRKRERMFINPTQGVGYNPRIDFNFAANKGNQLDFSQSSLEIDVTLTSSIPFPAAGDQPIAVKGSDLGLISGIRVRTEDNLTLYENMDLAYSTQLRLVTQKSREWVRDHGAESSFSMDRSEDGYCGMKTTANISAPSIVRSCASVYTPAVPASGSGSSAVPATPASLASVATNAGVNGENNGYNKGFAERCAFLQEKGRVSGPPTVTTDRRYIATISNTLLCDFFAQLDYAQFGTPIVVEYTLNFAGNTGYSCFCLGSSAQITGDANAGRVPDNYTAAVGAAPAAVGVITWGITPATLPRFYYHQIEYQNAQAHKFLEEYAAGYEKELEVDDFRVYKQFTGVTSGILTDFAITPSCTNPVRVFALVQPTGVAQSSTWPSVLTTGQNYLTNVDLFVAGQRQNNSPIMTASEQYELLKRAMNTSMDNESVGLIDYSSFLRTHRILCLDLTRLAGSGIPDPNTPLAITVRATPMGQDPAVKLDVTFIIQRKVKLVMKTKMGESTKVSVSI